jgi:hypothetical protein
MDLTPNSDSSKTGLLLRLTETRSKLETLSTTRLETTFLLLRELVSELLLLANALELPLLTKSALMFLALQVLLTLLLLRNALMSRLTGTLLLKEELALFPAIELNTVRSANSVTTPPNGLNFNSVDRLTTNSEETRTSTLAPALLMLSTELLTLDSTTTTLETLLAKSRLEVTLSAQLDRVLKVLPLESTLLLEPALLLLFSPLLLDLSKEMDNSLSPGIMSKEPSMKFTLILMASTDLDNSLTESTISRTTKMDLTPSRFKVALTSIESKSLLPILKVVELSALMLLKFLL